MVSLETACMYAMYVIGEVESHWNWSAINYSDPITIGMMQWYGTRAAGLLNRVKAEQPAAYATLDPGIRASVDGVPASNSTYWTSRFLNRSEGQSIAEMFKVESTHSIQQNQCIEDFTGQINHLIGMGFSLDSPQPLIFALSMWHQSPRSAQRVIQTAGSNANLDRIHSVCLNDSVLGKYKTRYNTVYNRLKAWDGASGPPDFGQVDVDDTPGSDPPAVEQTSSDLGYIIQRGDHLYLYGKGDYASAIFYAAGIQRWANSTTKTGTPIDPGTVTPTPPPPSSSTQQDIVNKMLSILGQLRYNQGGGRLTPFNNNPPYSDCSGTVRWCYLQCCDVDPGTYTDAQLGRGKLIAEGTKANRIPEDQLQLADLVIFRWTSAPADRRASHVEMYVGDGQVCGHGDPKRMGPHMNGNVNAYMQANKTQHWWVKRYL